MKNCILAISVMALAAVSIQARADSLDVARVRFREGLAYFAEGDWIRARTAFEQANAIHPDARILANVADCLAREGLVADAVETYRRALWELGAGLDEPTRLAIEEKLSVLRADVCDVRVTGEPPGGEVSIDGEVIGYVPMEDAVAVAPGRRAIEVRLEGYAPFRRNLDARGGQEVQLSIGLALAETFAPANDATLESPSPPRRARPRVSRPTAASPIGRGPLFWTGVAITGALAVGATITGVLSLERQREYRDPGTDIERRWQIWSSRGRLPLITDILIDVGVAVGAATLALFAFGGPAQEESERRAVSILGILSGATACDLGWSF